jgi:hypothetical protein
MHHDFLTLPASGPGLMGWELRHDLSEQLSVSV